MTITDFNYQSSYLPDLTCNIDIRVHIGNLLSRSTPQYWHLVVKNGNFTFLLLRVHIGRSTPHLSAMHHGMYIMGCIWQPFWILPEKVGICFYFSIIRVVISQLALYSVVRSNSPLTPQCPQTPPKYLSNDNYRFQLSKLIFARFDM